MSQNAQQNLGALQNHIHMETSSSNILRNHKHPVSILKKGQYYNTTNRFWLDVPELMIPGSPGQDTVLLHMRVSRKAPLHSVPYGEETHDRVLTCQPCPHVKEHTLHGDHSSAAGSPEEQIVEIERCFITTYR